MIEINILILAVGLLVLALTVKKLSNMIVEHEQTFEQHRATVKYVLDKTAHALQEIVKFQKDLGSFQLSMAKVLDGVLLTGEPESKMEMLRQAYESQEKETNVLKTDISEDQEDEFRAIFDQDKELYESIDVPPHVLKYGKNSKWVSRGTLRSWFKK